MGQKALRSRSGAGKWEREWVEWLNFIIYVPSRANIRKWCWLRWPAHQSLLYFRRHQNHHFSAHTHTNCMRAFTSISYAHNTNNAYTHPSTLKHKNIIAALMLLWKFIIPFEDFCQITFATQTHSHEHEYAQTMKNTWKALNGSKLPTNFEQCWQLFFTVDVWRLPLAEVYINIFVFASRLPFLSFIRIDKQAVGETPTRKCSKTH